METLKVSRSNAASRPALMVALLLVTVAASIPIWAPEEVRSAWMREFVEIACYLVFALMWNLLAEGAILDVFGSPEADSTGSRNKPLRQILAII